MVKPFIRNHQYNGIRKQADLLQRTCSTVADPKVVESVRYGALSKVVEAFPEASESQKALLENVATIHTAADFERYMLSLEPYLAEFAAVTEKQLKKLFPKNKKLKIPDLAAIDYRHISYLGWTDIATSKLFLAYHLDGQLVGVEGRYTPTNKKSVCFLCNRHEEVAFFSAITKTKPANASPDYYKAIGNYLCMNSDACNRNITDVAALESFIHNVVRVN